MDTEKLKSYLQKSAALMRLGCLSDAKGILDEAKKQFPDSLDLLVSYAELYMKVRDWDVAAKYWVAVREGNPRRKDGYLRGYIPYKEMCEYRMAEEILDKGLELFPELRGDYWRAISDLYTFAGLWPEAITAWNHCRALFPSHVDCYVKASIPFVELQKFSDAENLLFDGIAIAPENPMMYRKLAEVAAKRRLWNVANERWEIFRRKFPDRLEGYLYGSVSLMELKQTDLAKNLLDNAKILFPNNAEVFAALAKLLVHNKEWEAASSAWDKAREMMPQKSEYYTDAVLSKLQLGQLGDAYELMEEATQRFPSNPAPLVQLGRIAIHSKDYEKALRVLLDAERKFLGNDSIRNRLVEVYDALGNEDMRKKYADQNLFFAFMRMNEKNTWDDYKNLSDKAIHRLVFSNFSIINSNYSSPLHNSFNGIRRTVGIPSFYTRSIYMLGDSKVVNFQCRDDETISSFLQDRINAANFAIRLLNCGVYGCTIENMLLRIFELPLNSGDAVFVNYKMTHSPYGRIALTDICSKIERYFLAMHNHCTEKGVDFRIYVMPDMLKMHNPSIEEKKEISRRIRTTRRREANIISERRQRQNEINRLIGLGLSVIELQPLFDRPHSEGYLYLDWLHTGSNGNRVIADAIFEAFIKPLEERHCIDFDAIVTEAINSQKEFFTRRNPETVKEIEKYLTEMPRPSGSCGKKIGGIVMNCNPFTLGHRYLIEAAISEVDFLYIFVVEEDLSVFPFEDRLELVREGISDFADKVCVTPGGRFIISTFTFQEYFCKDNVFGKIDPSNDVMLWGIFIAPRLGISVRFVGEEPNCNVTKQYNDAMLRLLPKLGIEIRIIPRKEEAGNIISASAVRKYLKKGDLESIRHIVPSSTYRYLHRNIDRILKRMEV